MKSVNPSFGTKISIFVSVQKNKKKTRPKTKKNLILLNDLKLFEFSQQRVFLCNFRIHVCSDTYGLLIICQNDFPSNVRFKSIYSKRAFFALSGQNFSEVKINRNQHKLPTKLLFFFKTMFQSSVLQKQKKEVFFIPF